MAEFRNKSVWAGFGDAVLIVLTVQATFCSAPPAIIHPSPLMHAGPELRVVDLKQINEPAW